MGIERAKQFERKETKRVLMEDKVRPTYFLFNFFAIYAPEIFLLPLRWYLIHLKSFLRENLNADKVIVLKSILRTNLRKVLYIFPNTIISYYNIEQDLTISFQNLDSHEKSYLYGVIFSLQLIHEKCKFIWGKLMFLCHRKTVI